MSPNARSCHVAQDKDLFITTAGDIPHQGQMHSLTVQEVTQRDSETISVFPLSNLEATNTMAAHIATSVDNEQDSLQLIPTSNTNLEGQNGANNGLPPLETDHHYFPQQRHAVDRNLRTAQATANEFTADC